MCQKCDAACDLATETELAMPSYRTVEMAVVLAGLVLPAWLIWRLRCGYVSVPIGALLSCWFLVILAAFTIELNPGYDGIGAAMTILASPFLGITYALLLAGIRAAASPLAVRRRQTRSVQFSRSHTIVGLAIWGSLSVFSLSLPFVSPPRARRGDPLFLRDYFFFCGPVVVLSIVMSLTYAVRLCRRRWTVPQDGPVADDVTDHPVR